MRLFRSIASAQDGRIFSNMGAAFGINDETAAQVVRYFLPPMHKAILKRMENTNGLILLLDLIGAHRHDRLLANPAIFGHPKIEAEGRAILATLIPNQAYIRKIIDNRTKVVPLSAETLEKMLPYVAILTLGALELKTRQPLKDILLRILKGRADPVGIENPYKALSSEVQRRRPGQQPAAIPQERPSRLAAVIGSLFTRADARAQPRKAA
jgi:hypothetical protein